MDHVKCLIEPVQAFGRTFWIIATLDALIVLPAVTIRISLEAGETFQASGVCHPSFQ